MVDMARAEASPVLRQQAPGALTPSDATSPNYSRSGSFGDPTLASQAKGEILLAAMLGDLFAMVETFLADKTAAGGGHNAIPQHRQGSA